MMDVHEAKKKFVDYWGTMSAKWGVPPAMAQIHALLLASPEPLCANQICDELGLSAGSVSTNLRDLEQWGLVHRHTQAGRTKDHYTAEKDMWVVVRQIVKNRKERELDPMFKILDELCELEPTCPHSEQLCNTIQDIRKFTHKANDLLNLFLRNDANWMMRALVR